MSPIDYIYSMQRSLHRWKNIILLGIIIVFHTVGLIGLQSDFRAYFLTLSPLNLLLAMTCLLLSFRPSWKLVVDVLVVGLIGFGVEVIGVRTGYVFGDYRYGSGLGWKALDVPLILAVNWSMLSFATTACVLRLRVPVVVQALLSALLMTGLDVLIEPVAVRNDFWSWAHGVIPFYNYACWFLVALPVHYYLLKRRTPEQNPVAVGLVVVLIVFFGLLNWL